MEDASGDEFVPPSARTKDELDIPSALVQDLVLRSAVVEGKTSTVRLAEKLALSPFLINEIVEELRDLRYMEVQGLQGRDYILALTEAGSQRALERMQLSRYTGAAPVSLGLYTATVRKQHSEPTLNPTNMREAFSDLVLNDRLIGEIGPAAMSKGAMFIYGPPGTGKTSIAQRLQQVHKEPVLVPWAVEVDSQIITVYDPVLHKAWPNQPEDLDPRWLVCERPFITVGGELTGAMLDLAYQNASGVYLAPLQMQANNGMLVIDDFGRQALTPDALLNRWIVPLDRHIDYLSLDYGLKFEVPFDSKIVFSTNLEPSSLGDEAFFRRIQSKVLVPPMGDEEFDEVLRRLVTERRIEVTADAPAHLRQVSRDLGDGDLRPYLPGVVCDILAAMCRFDGRPLRLDRAAVDRIAHMFFTRTEGTHFATQDHLGHEAPQPTTMTGLGRQEAQPAPAEQPPQPPPAPPRPEPAQADGSPTTPSAPSGETTLPNRQGAPSTAG